MKQVSASHSADLEREELGIVLNALARTPRLAKLLEFLGEKYLQGKSEEITEYNIATEVFGRSKMSFDGSRDSIARVETHRLRKRLTEYYESEGKEHAIAISLPFRSYVPEFKRRATWGQDRAIELQSSEIERVRDSRTVEDDLFPALVSNGVNGQSESESQIPSDSGILGSEARKPGGFPKKALLYSVAAIVVLLVAGLAAVRLYQRHSLTRSLDDAHSSSSNQTATPGGAASVPLRLLAGYDGSPRIDSAGAYWQEDNYFRGGAAFRRPNVPVARTSDQMLFDCWRTGDFTYDIPLAPGTYELHLFFVASDAEEIKTAFFNVNINGEPLLKAFNIISDTLGSNIADERVFKDIHPDKDGYLHLAFAMDRSSPSLNAIEILPGLPHRQLPVRIVMQPAAFTDHDGNRWHPDNYFQNGAYNDQPREVSGTPDPKLYQRERYGHFTYSIPVDTRSRYTLVLHFAELYWIPDASGSVGPGSRIFRVYCNGSTLLDNFDIFKEAGGPLRALTKTFYHLRPSTEGKLDLTFEPIVNYATVSAIEVIDEGQ